MDSTTDKPRRIVVCNPAIYPTIQKAVAELGLGDVLVQSNSFVEEIDQLYVMDPSVVDDLLRAGIGLGWEPARPMSLDYQAD